MTTVRDTPTKGVSTARNSRLPWMLRRVNQRYRDSMALRLEKAGLGDLPQRGFWALGVLASGSFDAGRLIREMGVSKQAVSKLVETLVSAGYVDRRPNPDDRRKATLLLTEKGRRAAEVIRSAVRATERDFVSELGFEPFDELCRTLEHLASPEGRRSK
jgi:DNA-binding MarR family transcriptional regulator